MFCPKLWAHNPMVHPSVVYNFIHDSWSGRSISFKTARAIAQVNKSTFMIGAIVPKNGLVAQV